MLDSLKDDVLSERHLENAFSWLLFSEIQESSADERGGVYAWYDCKNETYSYLYPELTGYYLSCLTECLRTEPSNERVFSAAAHSASWLCRQFSCDEEIFTKKYSGERVEKNIFTFDLGVILNGLFDFNRLAPAPERDKVIRKIFETLSEAFEGETPALLRTCSRYPPNQSWSTYSGGHLLKTLAIMKKVGKFHGRNLSSLDGGIDFLLNKINTAGLFNFSDSALYTHFHAHLYAVEGLVMLNDKFLFSEAHRFFAAFLELTADSEGWPRFVLNRQTNRELRTDIGTQALRLSLLFNDERACHFRENAEKKISTMLVDNQDPRAHGGLLFGRSSAGKTLKHVNTCSSIFLTHYLVMKKKGTSQIF